MKEEDKLRQKFGQNPGFKTPERYFDDFYEQISYHLPEYPEKPRVPEMTRWQRMKPYVYLAAMFCGIWCMMKIFSDVSSRYNHTDVEVPQEVVLAMNDNATGDYVVEVESADDGNLNYTLQAEMCELYDNIEDFQSDFEYVMQSDGSDEHA